MLSEWGRLSLADVLAPAIQMADGYPIEGQLVGAIERRKKLIKEWPYSKAVFLTHLGEEHEAPEAGEVFKQVDLAATLRKLVDAEKKALAAGKSRRSHPSRLRPLLPGRHRGELVRGMKEQAGSSRSRTLRAGRCVSKSVADELQGIDVYKLDV